MRKKLKKGFTLVELVIVIAVIAILAAVLIPTFSGVVQRAKVARDQSDYAAMNTILSTAVDTDHIAIANMSDVLYVLGSKNNVTSKNLVTQASGYHFAWNSELNQIAYLNSEFKAVDENVNVVPATSWIVAQNAADMTNIAKNGFNVYLINNISGNTTLSYFANIDTGAYSIQNLTIQSEDIGSMKLSGTFKNLTINAPNAEIEQSAGSVETLNIQAVANGTMVVNGFVKNLTINQGKVEIAQTASVQDLKVNVTASKTVAVVNKGVIEKVSEYTKTATGASATFVNTSGAVKAKGDNVELPTGVDVNSTASHTTLIETRADLENFRDQVNAGRTFKGDKVEVTGEIDLTGIAWTPIGNFYREDAKLKQGKVGFQGTFDGGNKAIKGLSNSGFSIAGLNAGTNATSVEVNGKTYKESIYGLFGSVYDATIQNVVLTNVNIDMQVNNDLKIVGDSVSAIVGFACGPTFTMTGCSVDENSTVKAYDAVGALVGRMFVTTITIADCTNDATVIGSRHTAGVVGFISTKPGYNTASTVTFSNVTNNGDVTCQGKQADFAPSSNDGYYIVAAICTHGSSVGVDTTNNVTNNGTIKIASTDCTNAEHLTFK